jgi:vacuolar-type H+-ATPase subunit E/Vma4
LAAVTFIGGRIDDEEDARVSADGSLASVIATNKTDANTAISAEASSRVSADGSLERVIDANRTDANTAISQEVSDREQAIDALILDLNSEISRAESAEDSLAVALSGEVANLLANTDLTKIDSFQEVVNELENITNDFENTYFKKVVVSGLVSGTNKDFTLAAAVRTNSEAIYYNGLLQEAGVDYTLSGTAVQFTYFPAAGGKVTAYGVYA